MNSWVYIFSKFTSEALLFESLFIFILCCSYAAFWVLRKRRYGSIDTTIPSGPVKAYLNELIGAAEQLRLQLFGLLSSSGANSNAYRIIGLGDAAPDPEITKKLTELEARTIDQAKALGVLAEEKSRLEKELTEVKANSLANAASAKNQVEGTKELQAKVNELESKLTEYSVIEDDLANLKRLQQENEQLKALLNSKHAAANSNPISDTPKGAPTGTDPSIQPEVTPSITPSKKASEDPEVNSPEPTSQSLASSKEAIELDAELSSFVKAAEKAADSRISPPTETSPKENEAEVKEKKVDKEEEELVSEFE